MRGHGTTDARGKNGCHVGKIQPVLAVAGEDPPSDRHLRVANGGPPYRCPSLVMGPAGCGNEGCVTWVSRPSAEENPCQCLLRQTDLVLDALGRMATRPRGDTWAVGGKPGADWRCQRLLPRDVARGRTRSPGRAPPTLHGRGVGPATRPHEFSAARQVSPRHDAHAIHWVQTRERILTTRHDPRPHGGGRRSTLAAAGQARRRRQWFSRAMDWTDGRRWRRFLLGDLPATSAKKDMAHLRSSRQSSSM